MTGFHRDRLLVMPASSLALTHLGRPLPGAALLGGFTALGALDHGKPFAITLDVGSSRANHTGAWRTERPVYVDNLPPCFRLTRCRRMSGVTFNPGAADFRPCRKAALQASLEPMSRRSQR